MYSINIKKTKGNNNPISVSRFMADPYAMEYNGRVYVYGSNDSDSMILDEDGTYPKNQYGNMKSLNCVSSVDLVNWTDEGEIQVADDLVKGVKGAAAWAGNSWAPAVCHNIVDGKTKFFIYFANSAASIGVLTADSPTGPWTDPIGKALITHETPGCKDITWLFDPAVLVDDDGQAYLYFGGGVPEGKNEHPMTARVAKLGADMVSIDGEAVLIDAPYLFEDSGINKINNKYYYSYCTNWSEEAANAMGRAQISYMVSDAPMGPFEYVGEVMKNPGESEHFSREAWGNNHHCMMWHGEDLLMFYHSPQYEIDLQLPFNDKVKGGCAYRTTYIDVVTVNEDGTIHVENMTKSGTKQQICDCDVTNMNSDFAWAEGVTTVAVGDEKKPCIVWNEDKGYIGISRVILEGKTAISFDVADNKNDCVVKIFENEMTEECCICYGEIFAEVKNEMVDCVIEPTSSVSDIFIRVSGEDVKLAIRGFCMK